MIGPVRRSRVLALLLLFATPALGGSWLQAAHPCPVDSPWLQAHGAGPADRGAQGAAHHDQGGPGDHPGAAICHCVGTCAAAALAVLSDAPVVPIAAAPVAGHPARLVAATVAPTLRPADRLPPSTAPPLA